MYHEMGQTLLGNGSGRFLHALQLCSHIISFLEALFLEEFHCAQIGA